MAITYDADANAITVTGYTAETSLNTSALYTIPMPFGKGKQKDFHPKTQFPKGHQTWNKGLTKQDFRIAELTRKASERRNKFKLTEKDLRRMYLKEKLSINKIAKHYGCSAYNIRHYLLRYNIPIRKRYVPDEVRIASSKRLKEHPLMLGRKHSKESKAKMANGTIARLMRDEFPYQNTQIELLLKAELEHQKIPFIYQYPIRDKKGRYRFILDFLVEPNIVIEADGDYWHNIPKCKARDNRKDAFLKENGYVVFHFTESQIKESPSKCVEVVKNRYYI